MYLLLSPAAQEGPQYYVSPIVSFATLGIVLVQHVLGRPEPTPQNWVLLRSRTNNMIHKVEKNTIQTIQLELIPRNRLGWTRVAVVSSSFFEMFM